MPEPKTPKKPNQSCLPEWWHATQSFLLPGLVLSLITLAMGFNLIGSILLACNIGFLSWVLYHRFGLLASITVKRGVSYNLRHMQSNLHAKLYQKKCLNNVISLIDNYKKNKRILEKDGIPIILRTFQLYSDNELDGVGDHDITVLALEALFGLLRTSPAPATVQINQNWKIQSINEYINDLNNNLDMNETNRNELLILVLKVVAQLSENTPSTIRNTNRGWHTLLIQTVLTCMRNRMRDTENMLKSEKVQQWGCCVLFNVQHDSNEAKAMFGSSNGFGVVLDAVRRYRTKLKINQLAAVLMAESVFETVVPGSTKLIFLPNVFAEALSSGVMSALSDMAVQHPKNGDIASCNRLLKSEYSKPRKNIVEADSIEFVDVTEQD